MGLSVAALLRAFRSEMKDTIEPYFWLDDSVIGYFGEAQRRLCEDVLPLTGIFSLGVDPQTGAVSMDEEILRIRKVWQDNHTGVVEINSVEHPVVGFPNYDQWNVCGRPRQLTINYDEGQALYSPIPGQGNTVTLSVSAYRYPHCSPERPSDCLELGESYKRAILFYARYLARLEQDVETFDFVESNTYLGLYEREKDRLLSLKATKTRTYQPIQYSD